MKINMENKTILIVDDNELNRKLARVTLQFSKYKTLEAEDAESGIKLAQENKPDLILMDIQLPGIDGWSATRIIKGDPDLKDIPVIALTGFASYEDEEKAREVGCVGYISKPFSPQALLKTIEQCLIDNL